jgi:hypothetical protein
VLENPVIKSLTARGNGRRPKLIVKRQYDPEAASPAAAPKPKAQPANKKLGKKNKATTSQ